MGEYSFAGFCAGICFGFLYVLRACILSLYSVSWFAVCMSFAVERSSDSYPEDLITLIFACFGWGFICIGVYLSMHWGGWCLFLMAVGLVHLQVCFGLLVCVLL